MSVIRKIGPPAAVLAAGVTLAGCGSLGGTPEPTPAGDAAQAASRTTAARHVAQIARVRGDRIGVYDAPGAARPRSSLTSPNDYGAVRVLLVTRRSGGWLRVLLPTRPNGAKGWVRVSGVTLTATAHRVVIRLSALRFTVYDGDRKVRAGRIAAGTDDNPTPPGRFYFTELLRSPDPGGDYGPYAYGLSGHSPTLHRFGAGPGQLAVHGTNRPGLLGHRVSHGCIRVRNADITWMARHLVPGTPVTVEK